MCILVENIKLEAICFITTEPDGTQRDIYTDQKLIDFRFLPNHKQTVARYWTYASEWLEMQLTILRKRASWAS